MAPIPDNRPRCSIRFLPMLHRAGLPRSLVHQLEHDRTKIIPSTVQSRSEATRGYECHRLGGTLMSRLFGALRQMGFVVRDIHKAMRHWIEVCGVGPWFVAEKLPLDGFWYKEQPYDIHVTVALANSGDVQLELIQQRDRTPSMY